MSHRGCRFRGGHSPAVSGVDQSGGDHDGAIRDRHSHRGARTLAAAHEQGVDVDAAATQLGEHGRHHLELSCGRGSRPGQRRDRRHLELAERQRSEQAGCNQERHQAKGRREKGAHHHGEDKAHQQRRRQRHDPQHGHREPHHHDPPPSVSASANLLTLLAVIVRRPPYDIGERDQFVPSRRHDPELSTARRSAERGPTRTWVHGPDRPPTERNTRGHPQR